MGNNFNIRTLVAIGLFLAIMAAGVMSFYVKGKETGDFKVVYSAATAFGAGTDPYAMREFHDAPLNRFVYPPYTLFVFLPLTLFTYQTAMLIYLTVKLIAVGALVFLWNRIFDFHKYPILFLAFVPLAFSGSLLIDLREGNVSTFEQLFIWIGFYCYIRDRIAWFAVAIVVAAAFKLTPLLLLGLLATRLRKRDLVCLGITGTSVLAFLALSMSLWPQVWGAFFSNVSQLQLERGDNNPSTWALIKDVSEWLQRKTEIVLPGFVTPGIYLIISGAAIFVTTLTLKQIKSFEENQANLWRICLVCFLYALIVPRFKNYSYMLLIAPAFYILISRLWASPLPLFWGLFTIYSYQTANVLGSALSPFYHVQRVYYVLILAWVAWGLFCYSFLCRSSPGASNPCSELPGKSKERHQKG